MVKSVKRIATSQMGSYGIKRSALFDNIMESTQGKTQFGRKKWPNLTLIILDQQ